MENKIENELLKNIIRIVKGSIIAILITLVMLLIFAVILTYTSLRENVINPVIIVISIISILIGSSISTLKINKNGLLNGGLVGIIYILTIYVLSSITSSGFGLNLYAILMIVFSIIAGMVGGIIGVNMK